ncbi:hypothetical protein [Sphingomonas carotinifaciens]|uniref:hypothetical protein n=1 Tax=Sphingomonas carotinifaciens TaxID=1166323 RepID=UPI001793EB47|nr:hypothetical protein [Sphingomonas carotinifaciens]
MPTHRTRNGGIVTGWAIMYIVAGVLALIGGALLLALTRPQSAGKVYAYRMIGIMALAGAASLAASAAALKAWSIAP